VERVIAVGGGANSHLWRQIIADVTGKPVYRTKIMEVAALGAAILAANGVGLYKDTRQAAQHMAQSDPLLVEPHSDRRQYYQRLYKEVYQPLFPALQSSLGRLAEISDENFDK
jgi:sugar (pentulose or hexulose) kinase